MVPPAAGVLYTLTYFYKESLMDKNRWRYGDYNSVVAAVDSHTVIEIGDLLWQDKDDAKPASYPLPRDGGPGDLDQKSFASEFLGVSHQRSRNGDTAPICVGTTGVFEMECKMRTWELGDLVGAIPNDTGRLQNQAVGEVQGSVAIGRVDKRVFPAASSVLVRIFSTVMTGGMPIR